MKYEKLCNLIFKELTKRLSSSQGLAICCKYRSKFEGWLKVELCDIFARKNKTLTVPENNRIDISFDKWRIELKTINTSYRFDNAERKIRPITKNIDSLIEDIYKLRKKFKNTEYKMSVVFVVFPVMHNTQQWKEIHLPKVEQQLKRLKHKKFRFSNRLPGVIYIGLV
jgi:hypothetical protein